MDSPLYARNRNTVKTVDCEGRMGSKKGKKAALSGGKVMATGFFGIVVALS